MAKTEMVVRCDECRRVIFVEKSDGTIVHVARHDRFEHTTTYRPQSQPRKE